MSYLILFLIAYWLMSVITIKFGLKLYGGDLDSMSYSEQSNIKMAGWMWPLTLPLLLIGWFMAVGQALNNWPHGPGD